MNSPPAASGDLPMERALARMEHTSARVHGLFLAMVCTSVFFVTGPWAGFHGLLLGMCGLLVLAFPPTAVLPRAWWLLAGGSVLAGCAAFLPAAWFGIPQWRHELDALGVETGGAVVIQARQALEMLVIQALALLSVLWLAGHRASPETLRRCVLAFTLAVAAYAVFSRLARDFPWMPNSDDDRHFGFFPNRNHSATYLAMGALCGFGTMLQSGRDRRFIALGCALAATGTILWAIAAWSISRAGIVLTASGLLVWLSLLGRRYLGRHGLWAVALMLLGTAGGFVLGDSKVKGRLADTVEQVGKAMDSSGMPQANAGKLPMDSLAQIDFRIPVFGDTLEMIGAFPWTGVGAGQFPYVFPQYRKRTITAQDADAYHPESDWLWLAAEWGLPAALAWLVLLVFAIMASISGILSGRDRALRAACLIAALIVPLHGCFDVPGHRISLAWAAALLFSLSLRPQCGVSGNRRRVSLLLAPPMLLASAWLVHGQWLASRPPATTAAAIAMARAAGLYREDLALRKTAEEKGLEHQPDPAEDKLEHALRILDAAKSAAPLNRDLRRHEAFFAFHFDDKSDRIDQALAIDLALDPTWVAGPLRQAQTWAAVDPSRCPPLFSEALKRAEAVERINPENQWNTRQVREVIGNLKHSYPDLK